MLDDLTAAVLEAAAIGPVLLVLEDMHWADRSTQDFAASLSRTARGGLLLVLTFRSDELHHRHPFRKTLAEISRTFGSRRIDLGRLDRDDIAGIVAARTDGPPDPSVVSSVLARSEGNPLYAEELLAADQQEIPDHLSDLLLARIDALDEGPRALLRLASVNGTRLDTETLADLARLDQAQMEGYLREALDANVLRQNGDTLEFRHPLLREATYDDLMPDERTRTPRQAGRDPPGQGRRRARSRDRDPEPARLPLERRPRPAPHPGGVGPRRAGGEATGSRRGRHPARTRAVAVGPGPRRPGPGRPPAGRARRPPGRGGGRAG